MLSVIGRRIRKIRNRISRTNLMRRWLKLAPPPKDSDEPGLIVLQVDGLSRSQFEAAISSGRLPFLKSLIDSGYFRRLSFYSGLPSTTPAVQAEVMYGVKCAVPAFQFLHRKSGKVFAMFNSEAVSTVANEILGEGTPLCAGGASYSNIYSGGALEARCCAETTILKKVFTFRNVLKILPILPLYTFTILRVFGLVAIELMIGLLDAIFGAVHRKNRIHELRFVPSRCLVSIVLREWLRVVTKLAINRGDPIVYTNFLGYDEQAHHRGPSSKFALWVLKGIDGVAKDIYRTAKRSSARRYEVLVFSDHGQEHVDQYQLKTGHSIVEAVQDAIKHSALAAHAMLSLDRSGRGTGAHRQHSTLMQSRKKRRPAQQLSREQLAESVIVTAMGPIGHIYFPSKITDEAASEIAQNLVERHGVPIVVYRTVDGKIFGRSRGGLVMLPDDLSILCGTEHWQPEEMKEDLVQLCNNPNSGNLLIFGWQSNERSLTFVEEVGAHGSIGAQETRGFALLPTKLRVTPRVSNSGEKYIRGVDIHDVCFEFLAKKTRPVWSFPAWENNRVRETVRVLSYNVHSCVGVDGNLDVDRIAQVLSAADADIIALQEVDNARFRTGHQNQTQLIAEQLGMNFDFFPVIQYGSEEYGLSILSRFPMFRFRAEVLTEYLPLTQSEARGAHGVVIHTDCGHINVINTHLGLRGVERHSQIDKLLAEDWRIVQRQQPVILCGDLNAGSRSGELTRLRRVLKSVDISKLKRYQATFPSVLPIRRIDHILVSEEITVKQSHTIRTTQSRIASDHLPLMAELVVKHLNLNSNSSALEGQRREVSTLCLTGANGYTNIEPQQKMP